MRREVRANVIFIVVLVVLITPGFIFLMKKKLNGSTRPIFMPEAAPYQIAYIQPLPAPPVPRVEPKEVHDWVSGLVESRLGSEATARRRSNNAPPVLSDRFVTEVAVKYLHRDEPTMYTRIALVRWDDSIDLKTPPFIEVQNDQSDGTFYPARVVSTERIEVPRKIRHALQDVGYVNPPPYVWWIVADHSNNIAYGEKSLRLTMVDANGAAVHESIDFGTSTSLPPTTKKVSP